MPRLHGSGRNSMSSHKVTGYTLAHIIPLNSFEYDIHKYVSTKNLAG